MGGTGEKEEVGASQKTVDKERDLKEREERNLYDALKMYEELKKK